MLSSEKKFVLISCASKKLDKKAKAEELYQSQLFKKNLAYAKSLHPTNIFILSAKYGLLSLDKEIEPYNVTLNKMPINEIKAWADRVLIQLSNNLDLKQDTVIFLAGQKYRKFLIPEIKNYFVPLEGLGIGKQLKWLKEHVENE
jgi:cytoplasmic iron level regulating protein YaaA (DUF328/UPF0246 family)